MTDRPDSVITNLNQITRLPNNDESGSATNLKNRKNDENLVDQTNSTNNNEDNSITASKRPKNTALKQQRLPAWQPILTAKTVLPLFFVIGVIFEVLGGVLLSYSDKVNEYVYDYTNCVSTDGTGNQCSVYIQSNYTSGCKCKISIELSKDFEAPVYLYYGLKNFYQNHRRYVKSRDDNQLLGRSGDLNSECDPYKTNGTLKYAPCGAIANSLFNDSFSLNYIISSSSTPIDMIATGIAWSTDRNIKFKNPESWTGTIRPKNWQKDVQNLGSGDNVGYQNEDLIVWMRTAALPTFRKFYRRVDHKNQFEGKLPAGKYELIIDYNYPVTGFDGKKTFIISTTTWIGGKNPFLGIAYLVVGSICIVLGFVFLAVHFKFNKKSKHTTDSNNNRTNVATVESPN